jgi:uncharacterized membrane protein YeaQ/YmgE (transglycosylase-associated protein family)
LQRYRPVATASEIEYRWAARAWIGLKQSDAGGETAGTGLVAGLGRQKRWWETHMSGIIWIIIIGFVAGVIARFLSPGPNDPKGFILTTLLGIAGAFLATFIGQSIGWYRADQGAGFIAATLGALLVLFIWNRLVAHRVIGDPGGAPRS